MASVGAGRRQGEGVQDWAPVEEAKGRQKRAYKPGDEVRIRDGAVLAP